MKKHCRKHVVAHGFTLIEVVVVIMILVTLASVATPMYLNYLKKAKIGTAATQIKLLEDAITGFKLDTGNYPESLDALRENIAADEKWDGPYIKPAVPKDPWGHDYVYTNPGEHGDFDLVSYGADGQLGGTGENADITNYTEEN